MAIKELITLEGVEQVEAQLARINVAGEDSLKQFRDLGGAAGTSGFDKIVESAKQAGLSMNEATGHTNRLSEAFHLLHPILQTAGIHLTEFGISTRLIGSSVGALATALTGAVIIGFAKLEEASARTKGILTDLFGSPEKGDAAFSALSKQAQQFGTTVEGLAPGLEAFQTALNAVNRTAAGFVALKAEDLPGAQIAKNADAVSAAYGNFIKLLRAGRLTQDEAEKSAKAFFDTLKEGGNVSSAALKNLPVGTIELLKEALGAAGLTTRAFFQAVDQGAISVDKLQQALLSFGPQAERAFNIKAIKTFSDEFSRLLSTLNKGFEGVTGKAFSDFVIGEISRVRQGVQDSIDEFNQVRELLRREEEATGSDVLGRLVTTLRGAPHAGVTTGPTLEQAGLAGAFLPTPEQAGKAGAAAGAAFNEGFLKAGFIFAGNSLQQLGAAGTNAGAQIAKGIDQASASIQNMRDKAKETGQELQDIVVGSTRFKGRLDQIPVFEPQLAGEAKAAADEIKKTFVDNPFFKDGVKIPVEPVIKLPEAGFVIPTEDQTALVDAFRQTGVAAGEALRQGTQQAPDFSAWLAGLTNWGSQALSQAQSIYDQIKSIFAQPIPITGQFQGFGGQAGGAPFASGGMVRGAGSSTSDSILAWLSNREFVVNARAVSHYGPDLFAALNAMRLPRDFMGRFNMGGLVRALNGNKFAAGGPVRTGNPVVLKIDRQSFNMMAGDDTIAQLRRFAVASQLSSTGRKPSWVK